MISPVSNFPVALLAGGMATRLRPITEKIPKLLVEVAGEPFFSHQIRLLKKQGLTRVVLCVGYLGEMIVEQYGDGSKWGIEIEYSFDGPTLLGTGGALIRALPKLGDAFYILYGDSYLPIDYLNVGQAFRDSGKQGLMTVFENHGRYDASNVWFQDGRIKVYDKKNKVPAMHHIRLRARPPQGRSLERLAHGQAGGPGRSLSAARGRRPARRIRNRRAVLRDWLTRGTGRTRSADPQRAQPRPRRPALIRRRL
jgi:hypothetical protein